jgi:hypothetical protein
MKFSRHFTVAFGIILFGRPLANQFYRAYSQATGLGVQCTLPRVANPDPNLLLFVSGARWQAKVSAYSNYFVTSIQRGGWSLGSASSAAEMDCSSETVSYRCNPSDQCYQIIVEIVATGVRCRPLVAFESWQDL